MTPMRRNTKLNWSRSASRRNPCPLRVIRLIRVIRVQSVPFVPVRAISPSTITLIGRPARHAIAAAEIIRGNQNFATACVTLEIADEIWVSLKETRASPRANVPETCDSKEKPDYPEGSRTVTFPILE